MKYVESKVGKPGKGEVYIPVLDYPYIAIHNHPDGATFSPYDITNFIMTADLGVLTAVSNDGAVYTLQKSDAFSVTGFIHAYKKIMPQDPKELGSAENLINTLRSFLKEAEQYGILYIESGTQGP